MATITAYLEVMLLVQAIVLWVPLEAAWIALCCSTCLFFGFCFGALKVDDEKTFDFMIMGVPMTLALFSTTACWFLMSIAWSVAMTPFLFVTSPSWCWHMNGRRDAYAVWMVVGTLTYAIFMEVWFEFLEEIRQLSR